MLSTRSPAPRPNPWTVPLPLARPPALLARPPALLARPPALLARPPALLARPRAPVARVPVWVACLPCALVAVFLAAVWPATAFACTCVEQPQQEAFETADAVFEGQVLEIAPVSDRFSQRERMASGDLEIRLHVVRAWKGVSPVAEELTVYTHRSGGACGFPFEPGESYLVYAYATGSAPRKRAQRGSAGKDGPRNAAQAEGPSKAAAEKTSQRDEVRAEGRSETVTADTSSQQDSVGGQGKNRRAGGDTPQQDDVRAAGEDKAAAADKASPKAPVASGAASQLDQPRLHVSRCSRTRPVLQAEEDIIAMGMGAVPVDPRLPSAEKKAVATGTTPRSRPAGCASCQVGDHGGAPQWAWAWMGLALAVVVRRSRGRRARVTRA